MRIFGVIVSFLMLIGSLNASLWGAEVVDQVEIRVNKKMAPPSGWAVFSIQQGSEARPVARGQGCFTRDNLGGAQNTAFDPLFSSDPLILVENSRGEVSFRIDRVGPEGILFSFESSVPDVGLDNGQPFAYIALRVSPDAVPGTEVNMRLDTEGSVFYSDTGEPYRLVSRPGLFTVGGLSISCVAPGVDRVRAGEEVIIRGVGFEPGVRGVQVEFDGLEAVVRSSSPNQIVAVAPRDFDADYVKVRVRNRTRHGDRRPEDIFFRYRFGCLEE